MTYVSQVRNLPMGFAVDAGYLLSSPHIDLLGLNIDSSIVVSTLSRPLDSCFIYLIPHDQILYPRPPCPITIQFLFTNSTIVSRGQRGFSTMVFRDALSHI